MTIPSEIASVAAVVFLVIQLGTCAIAAWRCRPRAPSAAPADSPPITLVRPMCGVESHTNEILEAAFRIHYPDYELLFCVARPEDPVIPLVERAMARHPEINARLLVGDDPISGNPKLNNMVKGWREARNDRVVFADSNLLTPPDYLARLLAAWGPKSGLVSAPPIGQPEPGDFWGELESAFLNSYEARWQYVVDAFGQGFAQGKTLFYKKSLIPGGVEALASEPAEDSATTKIVRGAGLQISLARPPFLQPLGRRTFKDVWSRQGRWAKLRRLTFPHLYAPEVLTGAYPASIVLIIALSTRPALMAPGLLVYLALWYGAEAALCLICGWSFNLKALLAFVARDALIPALWAQALAGSRYVWKGQAIQAGPAIMPALKTNLIRFDFSKPRRDGAARERSVNALLAAQRARSRVASAIRRRRRED